MLDKRALLQEIESRAKSRAEMARVLGVAPPRITEMFKGERDLSYSEARTLCQHYKITPRETVSAALLVPILSACLRDGLVGKWSDQDIFRLAEEIEYGLQLLGGGKSNHPSQDALEIAARVAADRFHHKRGKAENGS